MSEAVEKVAQAIQGALGETYSSPQWKYLSEGTKNEYRSRAKAAIEALGLTGVGERPRGEQS